MPKKINYQLSEDELKQIEEAQRTSPDPRVRQRATGLRLLHRGEKPAKVAELLNVSQATVFNWHADWRAEGIKGLSDKPRSGRPPLATEAYCAKVGEVLETDPTTLGYGFTCWTIQRLIAHLGEATGIYLSINAMRNVLAEQDYVCRRPKHELKPLQDADARATAKALLDDLKKSPSRRDPTIRYGRNDLEFAATAAALLDEAWSATHRARRWPAKALSPVCSVQPGDPNGHLA